MVSWSSSDVKLCLPRPSLARLLSEYHRGSHRWISITTEYVRFAEYLKCIKEQTDAAESLKKNLFISDVVSSDGPSSELQWVDLVLAGKLTDLLTAHGGSRSIRDAAVLSTPMHLCMTAGGGLLGIAHVGFVCIMEKAGIRFRGIGGTSAGAINAIIIAAVRDNPAAESWEKTLEVLVLAMHAASCWHCHLAPHHPYQGMECGCNRIQPTAWVRRWFSTQYCRQCKPRCSVLTASNGYCDAMPRTLPASTTPGL